MNKSGVDCDSLAFDLSILIERGSIGAACLKIKRARWYELNTSALSSEMPVLNPGSSCRSKNTRLPSIGPKDPELCA